MRRSIFIAAVLTGCSGSSAGPDPKRASVSTPAPDSVAASEASGASGASGPRPAPRGLGGVGPCTPAVLAARILSQNQCPLPPRPGEFHCRQELIYGGMEGSTTWVFDSDARRITATNHYTDGRPSFVAETYQYDAEGNLVDLHSVRPNGETMGRQRYAYDDAGRLTRIQWEYEVGSWDLQLGYDDDGKVITAKTPRGELARYIYDDEGRLLRREGSVGRGTTGEEYSYRDGRLAKRVTRSEDQSVETAYTYDGAGNLVDEVETVEGELRERTKRSYDAAGHVVREDIYNDYELEETKLFRYDDKGRLTHTSGDEGGDGSVDTKMTEHYECDS